MYLGRTLYGYCGGYFGRDSYDPKVVVAIGDCWVVVKEDKHYGFATFESNTEMVARLDEWSSDESKQEWEDI